MCERCVPVLLLPDVLFGLGQATQICPRQVSCQVHEAGSLKEPGNAALLGEWCLPHKRVGSCLKAPTVLPTPPLGLNKTPLERLCSKALKSPGD